MGRRKSGVRRSETVGDDGDHPVFLWFDRLFSGVGCFRADMEIRPYKLVVIDALWFVGDDGSVSGLWLDWFFVVWDVFGRIWKSAPTS